jgi:hypothetical protein
MVSAGLAQTEGRVTFGVSDLLRALARDPELSRVPATLGWMSNCRAYSSERTRPLPARRFDASAVAQSVWRRDRSVVVRA